MSKIIRLVNESNVCGVVYVDVIFQNNDVTFNGTILKSEYILRMALQTALKDQNAVEHIMHLASNFADEDKIG